MDLYYAGAAQPLTTAGEELDGLDHDLSYLSVLHDLDHDIFDLSVLDDLDHDLSDLSVRGVHYFQRVCPRQRGGAVQNSYWCEYVLFSFFNAWY